MASPVLRIRLLGQLDLRRDGAPLPPLESARAASLLAYLLLHRDAPQARQRLAFRLWPDSTEPQALTNLRHVLHDLRRALPDADRFLEVTARTLGWRADAPYWLDLAAFEAAAARAEGSDAEAALDDLRAAVELYRGDLLEGCDDEWLLAERERLGQRHLGALARLAELLAARGRDAEAVPYAERLLRGDPLREETYRLLMRLHDARGDRARALRVFHACATTLERELGVEPSAPTREAYEALLPADPAPRGATRPAAGRVGGPPMVGRAGEWARLTGLWRAAEDGAAQLVLVGGEPGIGKTRLVEELRAWCAHRGAATAEARAYQAEGALAYGPVVAWLRSEPLRVRPDRLDRARLSELARLLPELLAAVPDLPRPEPLPEAEQRQRLFDAVAQALLTPGGPLLLVADDLQWWDRESLQLVHYLLRAGAGVRLLVAATVRSEELDHGHPVHDLRAGLRALGRLTEIELERLPREETAALAARATGQPLDAADAERLYRETEGNPLFVVEALRAGWSPRDGARARTSPRVQAVIESRLGQLSDTARELVGLAATVGREFTADVLAAASDADADTLVRGLDELWRRRLVREQGADAYDFGHDRIREVAYLALSPARRRRHHLRVAEALARRHAGDPGPVSGQVAGHYEQAGAADQAVAWYQRAAEAALRLHAHGEAVRLLERALALLGTRPGTPERDARELAILSAMPAALLAVDGYDSDRFADLHRRAGELAPALGVELAPPLLRSIALASLSRGDFEPARRAGEQLRARGERDSDDVLLVEAAYVLGIAAFWRGELDAAQRHFEAAVERYRPEHGRAHLLWYGQDPRVVCQTRLANTLWLLGRPEAAARASDAGLAWAEETGHPYTRAVALVFGAVLAFQMRDPERLRTCAAALDAGRSEHGALQIANVGETVAGYLDVLDGRAEAGLARIRRTLAGAREGAPAPGHYATVALVLLTACAAAGDVPGGLAAADLALGASGVPLWEADVRRLRAELLASRGAPVADVEAELRRAREVARGQGARLFELRAAASLLRYRMSRGDAAGSALARASLADALAALPEPADTPDRREAAALLGRPG